MSLLWMLFLGLIALITLAVLAILVPIGLAVIYYHLEKRKYTHLVAPYKHLPGPFVTKFYEPTEGDHQMEAFIRAAFDKENNQYHDVMFLGPYVGGQALIGLTHPEDIKRVLGNPDSFVKGSNYDIFKVILGEGLATSQGPLWKGHRRTLTPAFYFEFLREIYPTLVEKTTAFVSQIRALNGRAVDPISEFSTLTLEMMTGTSFGKTIDEPAVLKSYKRAFEFIDLYFVVNLFMGKIGAKLPLEPIQRVSKERKVLEGLINEALEKRRNAKEQEKAQQDGENKKSKDFVSLMIAAGLSDEEIMDHTITFLFAAHDTSANTLSWCLYFLIKHPEYRKKLKAELDEGHFDLANLTLEKLESFELLKQVVKETLRLRPALMTLFRELTEDMTCQNGQKIFKGCYVNLFSALTQRDPRFWENPDKFYPERFSNDSEENTGRHSHSFLAFSAGPRSCIGRRLAMIQVTLVLGALIKNFDLEGHNMEKVVIETKPIPKPVNLRVSFNDVQ